MQSTILVSYQFRPTSRPSSVVYKIYNLQEKRTVVHILISYLIPFPQSHKTSHTRSKIGESHRNNYNKNLNKESTGKSVPLQARGAQRIPRS